MDKDGRLLEVSRENLILTAQLATSESAESRKGFRCK